MESLIRKNVILLIERSGPLSHSLVKGIMRYSNHHLEWSFCRESSYQNRRKEMVKWQVDGVIAHVLDSKMAKKIVPLEVPAVVKGINEIVPNMANIVIDIEAVGKMAFEHLRDHGFESFAFVGFEEELWSRELSDYVQQEYAADIYMEQKSRIRKSYEKELGRIVQWLDSLEKPVGIAVGNDDCGRHVIEACKHAGYQIPAEVGIINVEDNEGISDWTCPPMSSIQLNTEKAGYEAAELLDRLMLGQGDDRQKITIHPVGVIVRQSTDVCCVDDPEIRKALEYIKENYEKPIQSDDVVKATTISRRALYDRFKQIMGHSINDELRRVRVEKIAKLIVETDIPISQIVDQCRYTSLRNVSRYFKREKGMSLLEYRKKFGNFH